MFRKERRHSSHPPSQLQEDGVNGGQPESEPTKKRFSLIRAFSKLSRSNSFQNLPKFSMGVSGNQDGQDKAPTTPGIFSKFFKRDGKNGGCETEDVSTAAAASKNKRKSLWQRSKSIFKAAATAKFSKSTSLSKSEADLEDNTANINGSTMNEKYRLIGSGLMTRIEFNTTASINEITLDTDGILLKLLESNREAYEMLKERKRLESQVQTEANNAVAEEVFNSEMHNDSMTFENISPDAAYQGFVEEHFAFQDNIQLDSPLLSGDTDNESSCIISESEFVEPMTSSYESSVYNDINVDSDTGEPEEEEEEEEEQVVGHTIEEMTEMFDILGINEPERFPDGTLRYVLEVEAEAEALESALSENVQSVMNAVEIIEFVPPWQDDETLKAEDQDQHQDQDLKIITKSSEIVGMSARNAKSVDTFASIQLNEIAPNPTTAVSFMKKARSLSHCTPSTQTKSKHLVTTTTTATKTEAASTVDSESSSSNSNLSLNLNLDRRHSMGERVSKLVAIYEGGGGI